MTGHESTPTPHQPRVLIRSGRVGLGGPVADVLVEGGRITSIETGHRPRGDEHIVDAAGGTVLPGLVDAHVHATQQALARRRIDVAAATSATEVVDLIRARLGAEGDPADAEHIVTAYGFRPATWAHAPRGALLDEAFPNRPVVAVSNDLHMVWFNRAAGARIPGDVPPDGVAMEDEALTLMGRIPGPDAATLDEWVADAMAEAARRGVCAVVDFEVADNLTDWARRAAAGPLPVGVVATIYPEYLEAAIAAGRHEGDPLAGGRVRVGPLKIFVDGSLNARTALCHRPFVGTDERGLLVTPPERLEELVRRAHAGGIGSAVHAIGDHAADVALDAFERVGCAGRIEHAQLMRPDAIRRMARLGVVAGIQPMHALDDKEVAERLWGDRLADAFPHGALNAAGVRIEIGSDAPVSPLDPWLGIAAATWRTHGAHDPWGAEQRIDVADALAAAAGGRRSVATEDSSDLVVVGGDPTEMGPEELAHAHVVATVSGGTVTWQADRSA